MQDKIFIKHFENKVRNTIKKYNLITKKDRILVSASGGKDSTTALYLLKKFGYDVKAIIIDLLIGEYSKKNLENLRAFCKANKIKLHVISLRDEFGSSMCYIRSAIQSRHKLKSCTICGVIKRYLMNKKSRELKATKLVTGHNLDDESQTILMNLLRGNISMNANLNPKTGVISDKKFVNRIKPLYFCSEKEIKRYSKIMQFPVLYESCPCATGVYRFGLRKLLRKLEIKMPEIKENIVNYNLKNLAKLRKEILKQKEELKYCKLCGEPSRQDVCNTCKLIRKMRH